VSTALHEDDLVVLRDVEECPELALGLVVEVFVGLGTVREFHEGDARVVVVEELGLGSLENGTGDHGGASAKVPLVGCCGRHSGLGDVKSGEREREREEKKKGRGKGNED